MVFRKITDQQASVGTLAFVVNELVRVCVCVRVWGGGGGWMAWEHFRIKKWCE